MDQPRSKAEAKTKRIVDFQAELSNEIWRFLKSETANLMKIRARDRRVGMTEGLAQSLFFFLSDELLPVPCKIRIVTVTSRMHSCSNHEESFSRQLRRPELNMKENMKVSTVDFAKSGSWKSDRVNVMAERGGPLKTCRRFFRPDSSVEVELWSAQDVRNNCDNRLDNQAVDLCIVDDYSMFKKEYLEFLQFFSKKIIIAKTGVEHCPLDVDIELIENRKIQRPGIAYSVHFEPSVFEQTDAVIEDVE